MCHRMECPAKHALRLSEFMWPMNDLPWPFPHVCSLSVVQKGEHKATRKFEKRNGEFELC